MSTTTVRQLVQTGIVTEAISSNASSINHIDTYQTFELGSDHFAEMEFEHFSGECGVDLDDILDFDDVDWHYDNDGWKDSLAQGSVQLILDQLPDRSIVKDVVFKGETFSPAYYNFTTDGYMADWTIDADALERWLADNEIQLHDGHGISGFIRTADDAYWFIAKAVEAYLEREVFPDNDYTMRMFDYGANDEYEFTHVTFTAEGLAKIEAAGGDISALPAS